MPGSILGNVVRRVEDPELLVGVGHYVGDLPLAGALHCAFVRSPYAHARVSAVEVEAARAMPGVVGLFREADLGIGAVPPPFRSLNEQVERRALATDKVRFVGEAVVLVVAESLAQALDACEAVVVEYEPLEAVTDLDSALLPGAPVQFEALGSNAAAGLQEVGEDPLVGAAVVVRARLENQRVAVAPMEGNAIAVVPGEHPALTIHVATQMPHRLRDGVKRLFDLPPEEIRVITPNVGGAFGGKVGLLSDYAAVIAAARRLGRTLRWSESRTENLVGMHGRSQVQYGEMGFDADGKIVGLRAAFIGDAGAYAGFGGGLAEGSTRSMVQGVYEIPKIHVDVVAAMTNTSPVGAFRGAGRPEAAAFLERLMDLGASELGIDPAELRRRNLIAKEAFPYRTRTGVLYDVGDFALPLERALEVAGYVQLRAEQARRREAGERLQLGIGLSVYVEVTAGGPGGEFGAVEVHPDGAVTIRAGTAASGQGHATAFSMIVADRLGVAMEKIRYVQADTAEVPRGGGTGGSRSLQLGGAAVQQAADSVVDLGRELAAELLEADAADVVVTDDGTVGVAGIPARALGWGALAAEAEQRGRRLEASADFSAPGATFPFGAHLSVVEVDTETGFVRALRHVAVDDAGRIVSPLLVTGQQHGGIAQGVSQALYEMVVYDGEGNPETTSFATYCLPSAAEFCSFEASNTETPTPYNPLGAKGIGESATVGATPAVQNAVIDAVAHLGVRHIDLPMTPERVWRALAAAREGAVDPWREPPDVFSSLLVRAPVVVAEDTETV